MAKLKRKLPIFKQIIRFTLEDMRYFVETNEAVLRREARAFRERAEQSAKGLDEDQREEYFDFLYDEHQMLTEVTPQWARRAAILVEYGAFEQVLATICRTVLADRHEEDPKRKEKGPEDTYAEASARFLKNTVGLTDADFSPHWAFLMSVRSLRNFIAHNGGILRRTNKNLTQKSLLSAKALAKNDPDLSLDDYDQLKIESQFCERLADAVKTSVESVLKAIPSPQPNPWESKVPIMALRPKKPTAK